MKNLLTIFHDDDIHYVSINHHDFPITFSPAIPSGELTKSNWKWPSRNSGFSHKKWWIFPLLCKRSPEGKPPFSYGFSYGFPMVFPFKKAPFLVPKPLRGQRWSCKISRGWCMWTLDSASKWRCRTVGVVYPLVNIQIAIENGHL